MDMVLMGADAAGRMFFKGGGGHKNVLFQGGAHMPILTYKSVT